MNKKPLISIIIPVFNQARELEKCLRSMLDQTFQDFELIVVNDGSTDNTKEVMEKFTGKIIPIHQENNGSNPTRNRGFSEAQGKYLVFCDADLYFKKSALQKMFDALQSHPEASYSYCDFRYGFKKFHFFPFNADELKKRNFVHTWALIRREHFPGFDEKIKRFQDWDVWLTMLEQGHIGVWVPELLFHATPHKGGISTWLPKFVFKIPFHKLGFSQPKRLTKYRDAEKIIKEKHHLLYG